MRLLALLLCSSATLVAAEELGSATVDDEVFGLSRAVVTLLGLGAALMLLALLFLIRRFMGTIMNITFLLLGALLVIIALFGHQIGVYDAIDTLISADPVGP
jgi:hypothetical protein